METNDIIENNALIARFMGLAYCEKYRYEGWYKNVEFNNRLCDYDGLKYHKSWDWLMPVVLKITQNEIYCGVDERENIMDLVGISHIEDVYHAVIEFIKWRNTNKDV